MERPSWVTGAASLFMVFLYSGQDMHTRQAALLESAQRVLVALTFPREFHLPSAVRGTEPENPEGTDLYVWKYEVPPGVMMNQPQYGAVAFVGKASKPLWHHLFRDPSKRDQAIAQTAEDRRRRVEQKAKDQAAKRDFQHGFVVGDILYSSWGYDQTNVNFYQVTEVRGKEVVIREISLVVVAGAGGPSEKVMAEPDDFIGPPLRKRPQGTGAHTYVKVSDSQTAFEWDGRPLRQTGAQYGH